MSFSATKENKVEEKSRPPEQAAGPARPVIGLGIIWLIAIMAGLGLIAANLIFGNLNQDEGWYLYAARLISNGQMPYRDFAFTQGPVMPYIYALFYPLIDWGGLAAGRLLTAAFGLLGALAAARLAGRLARPGQRQSAALLCFILLTLNVYQAYFCTVVKTYSITILLLATAFLALQAALARGNKILTMAAAALLVLAAATRTSAAAVLPVVFGLLWLARRRFDFSAWLYFALGGSLAAGLALGPFLLNCPFNFYYFAGRYHTLRDEGGFLPALIFKAGFISRFLQAYFVCFAAWIAAMIIELGGQRPQLSTGRDGVSPSADARNGVPPISRSILKFLYIKVGMPLRGIRLSRIGGLGEPSLPVLNFLCAGHGGDHAAAFLRRALWLSASAVSLVHLFAPFPYDDYQVFVFPFFAIAVAGMLLEAVGEHWEKGAVLAVLCLALVSAVSSPLNQEWFIEGRELIWWKAKDRPQLVKLRQTAAKIRALCKPGELLLTQDPYLAVESGAALPHGLEMGQFSYFPGLTQEQALKFNVLSREMFADLLRNCPAPMAAFSGYGFALQAPKIIPVVAEDKALFTGIIGNRYELLETIPHFGQAATDLRLYRKK